VLQSPTAAHSPVIVATPIITTTSATKRTSPNPPKDNSNENIPVDTTTTQITEKDVELVRKHIHSWRKQEQLRSTISYIYQTHFHSAFISGHRQLHSSSHEEGIITSIAKFLNIHRTHCRTVKTVVMDTIACLKVGEEYEPTRRTYTCPHRRKIADDSLAMHLITCIKERGASFKLTVAIYNALVSAPQGRPPIYYSAIYRAITNSNHRVSITERRCQANDRNRMWRQARFNASSQLLVRLGGAMPEDTSGAILSDPSLVDAQRLKREGLMINLEQIGWWDEKHIPQVVGEVSDINYHFGRNEQGVYDPSVDLETVKKVSVSVVQSELK
jgi:hypothetical protein